MPSMSQEWPEHGKIEFINVILKYLDNELPALNGISFTVLPRQHIAIVGRTGSGKSSIFASLLRKNTYSVERTITRVLLRFG